MITTTAHLPDEIMKEFYDRVSDADRAYYDRNLKKIKDYELLIKNRKNDD